MECSTQTCTIDFIWRASSLGRRTAQKKKGEREKRVKMIIIPFGTMKENESTKITVISAQNNGAGEKER